MKREQRNSVSAPMKAFDSSQEDSSFIEVTEWTNGEGWDIVIDNKHISLHYSELQAINFMTDFLMYGDNTDFYKED